MNSPPAIMTIPAGASVAGIILTRGAACSSFDFVHPTPDSPNNPIRRAVLKHLCVFRFKNRIKIAAPSGVPQGVLFCPNILSLSEPVRSKNRSRHKARAPRHYKSRLYQINLGKECVPRFMGKVVRFGDSPDSTALRARKSGTVPFAGQSWHRFERGL